MTSTSIGNLDGEFQGLLQGQWPFRQPSRERLSLQMLHDQARQICFSSVSHVPQTGLHCNAAIMMNVFC